MGKKHSGTYFLDLADNGYWLIKSEVGYRECIGVGDEGKKVALKKIKRLNKGGIIKPMTEEWIEERAMQMSNIIQMFALESQGKLKGKSDISKVTDNFVRQLIKDLQSKKK